MNIFTTITPGIYWLLVILWAFIFLFYLNKLIRTKNIDQLIKLLLIILAIDAFRTLFESTFFGLWYTSLAGLLPIYINDFLTQPQIVFVPKIFNLFASVLILFFLIRKWIPAEMARNLKMNQVILVKTEKLNLINKELLENKQILDEAQSMANIGHWELNFETQKMFLSDEVVRILGYNKKGYKSDYNSFLEIIHPADRKLVKDKFSEAIEHKKSISIVSRIVFKSGKIKTVEIKTKPHYNEINKTYSLVGMLWDVTKQKRNEQEFLDYKEMLENNIQKRTIELENKNIELQNKNSKLEEYNQLFADREIRIKELKDRVIKLESEL